MTAKRNYSRYFIILQEDEKGYSLDPNKFPTGYAKVERKNNKCKVSYYVQNLKKSNDSYCMVLICDRKKDKRLVKVGEINIDAYGRAEVSYEYDINNIANCNIPMDNIKGASIVRIKDSNVHGILTGFVSGEKLDDWKSYVLIEGESRTKKESEQSKEEVEVKKELDVNIKLEEESKENIFDKYESEIEKHKETKEEVKNELRQVKDEVEVKEENREENIEVESKENEEIELEIKVDEDVKNQLDKKETREIKDVEEIKEVESEIEKNIENEIKEEVKIGEIEVEENLDAKEEIKIEEKDTRKCECDCGFNLDCDCDCEDKKKSKDKKEEKKKDKEKEKEKQKDKDKEKEKEKSKDKKKDKCPYEEYCHMNWEKEYYKHIVEGLKEEKGICEELGKCQWYKIDYMDLIQMKPGVDFSKYSMIYYPMINYISYIMRKGHYLMGFKYDKEGKMKYLVYAIPGTKSIVDQPFNGATGFVTWVPKYAKDNDSNNGYWVMLYDFKKCTVVIPIKKQ